MSTVHAVNGSMCSTGFSPVLSRSYKGQIIFTQNTKVQTANMFKYINAVNFDKSKYFVTWLNGLANMWACSEVLIITSKKTLRTSMLNLYVYIYSMVDRDLDEKLLTTWTHLPLSLRVVCNDCSLGSSNSSSGSSSSGSSSKSLQKSDSVRSEHFQTKSLAYQVQRFKHVTRGKTTSYLVFPFVLGRLISLSKLFY